MNKKIFGIIKWLPLIALIMLIPTVNATSCGNQPSSVYMQLTSCLPVNVINTAVTATPINFVQEFNSLPFNALNGNWLAYNGVSGTFINCWAESNSLIWCNLGNNIIKGSGTVNSIYYFGLGTSGTNFLSSNGYSGEAPQLSASYAQYDNGNNVFSFYDPSPSGSQWSSYGSGSTEVTTAPVGDYFGTSNALTSNTCGGGYGTNNQPIPFNAIITFFTYASSGNSGGSLFAPASSIGGAGYGVAGGTGGSGILTESVINQGASPTLPTACGYNSNYVGNYLNTGQWYQNQMVIVSNTVTYYTQPSNSNTGISSFGTNQGGTYSYISGTSYPSGGYMYFSTIYPATLSPPVYFSGFVVRPNPPNGTMPTPSYGAFQSSIKPLQTVSSVSTPNQPHFLDFLPNITPWIGLVIVLAGVGLVFLVFKYLTGDK